MLLFKININSDAVILYLSIVILSAVLTFLPLIYKLKDFNINASANVQVTALYQVQQMNINDCSQLQANDYGRFKKMKENLMNNCGGQDLNDISYITTGIISTMYSAFYTEFSLASAFISAPKRKNLCLSAIDAFLTMCPERKIYFSQENLQMLRDFERKQ